MELTSKKDIKKDFEHQKKITEELHSDWTEDDKARAKKMSLGKYREALEQRKKDARGELADKISKELERLENRNSTPKSRKREAAVEMQ